MRPTYLSKRPILLFFPSKKKKRKQSLNALQRAYDRLNCDTEISRTGKYSGKKSANMQSLG